MFRTIKPNVTALVGTGIGVAVANVVVWLTESLTTLTVPPEVGASLGLIFGALIGHAAGFTEGEKNATK